ncbi:MAG TPA: 50S ribosomal protein L29 [Candidatus Nanoarchaeia archaeon]|nr:50S ribosomal protein L29 [Candidatus Nanoarchaeia archaeon]
MNESTAREKMNDLKKELIKINAQIAMGTLPQSPGRIKEIKRTVTKLNMILNKKTKEEKKTV